MPDHLPLQSLAEELLRLPVTKFPPIDPSTPAQLSVPKPSAGKSTDQWAAKNLSQVRLESWKWELSEDGGWDEFLSALQGVGLVDQCVPKPIVENPMNEGDTVTLVDTELLSVVHRIGKSWLPEPQGKSRGMEWHLEVMSEAYAKSHGEMSPSKYGVRVDKIFVVSAKKLGSTQWTRSMYKELGQGDVVSKHAYLPRDTLWGLDPRSETVQPGQRKSLVPNKAHQGGTSVDPKPEGRHDMGYLKGLVAVEIKTHGYLNEADRIISIMAAGEEVLGHSSTQVKEGKAVRAVLQQGLRYAHHYGTKYVCITDFKTMILLEAPVFPVKKQGVVVQWSVVNGDTARLGLAFLLYCACKDMLRVVKAQ